MGTVAITAITQGIEDNKRFVDCTITGSASYATGGDTLSPATVGLKQIDRAYVKLDTVNDSGWTATLAGTASVPLWKLWATKSTQTANAVNTSTGVWNVRLVGS